MGTGTGGGKANLPISVDKYGLLVSARYVRALALNNPIIVLLIFCALLIGVLYWFFGTELGCALRATGANQHMARAQGINTNVAIVLGLMISNGLVALAGGLLAQYQGFSDINMGRGAIVIGLAAVIIGEVVFGKIFRNFALKLTASVIGAIIYYIVMNFVLRMGLSTDDLKLLTALVVAMFLTIPYWKGKNTFTKVPVKKGEARTMLEIKNVYKTFNAGTVNEKVALKGLDLTLEDGDFVTVIGGNGAGKSTMLNAVAGVWPWWIWARFLLTGRM